MTCHLALMTCHLALMTWYLALMTWHLALMTWVISRAESNRNSSHHLRRPAVPAASRSRSQRFRSQRFRSQRFRSQRILQPAATMRARTRCAHGARLRVASMGGHATARPGHRGPEGARGATTIGHAPGGVSRAARAECGPGSMQGAGRLRRPIWGVISSGPNFWWVCEYTNHNTILN